MNRMIFIKIKDKSILSIVRIFNFFHLAFKQKFLDSKRI